MIDTISIFGLRGFGKEQTISFAKPDHKTEGSGLTFIVGANNTGKTTIIEAIKAFNHDENNLPSYSQDKRNDHTGKMVRLQLSTCDGNYYSIESIRKESGLTKIVKPIKEHYWNGLDAFILNSRRAADYEFSRNEFDRSTFIRIQANNQTMRRQSMSEFGSRLFAMDKHREQTDPLLKSFFGDSLQWGIEVTNGGQFFLNISTHNMHHSSEGMGDGIWSIFTICDALRDLEQDQTVVIDEPELSLHPTYQKKLMRLLVEKAKDRQIVVSTHSPYFIDLESLSNGAHMYRTIKDNDGDIRVHALSERSTCFFRNESKNLFNPHLCGTEAKELFFLEDNVIVVEGQDDVVYYSKAAKDLSVELKGEFYGWGAGGAGNIPKVLSILHELGYSKAVAIYDGDKAKEKEEAENAFSEQGYLVLSISTDDIRDKFGKSIDQSGKEGTVQTKNGLMTEAGIIKEPSKEEMQQLFASINQYFDS